MPALLLKFLLGGVAQGVIAWGVLALEFRHPEGDLTGRVCVPLPAAAAVGIVHFPYNRHLTGNPWTFPIMAYIDKYDHPHSNDYGFGPERGVGWPIDPFPGRGPRDALVNASLNAYSRDHELFGASCESPLFLAVCLFSGRMQPLDRAALMAIVITMALYAPYYFSGGPDFGARYWFLVLVPCIALTVRGIGVLGGGNAEMKGGDPRVLSAVMCLLALTVVNDLPWRAIDKYDRYDTAPRVPMCGSWRHGFGRSLVLIWGERDPDYMSAAICNPIDRFADAPIYAWERNLQVRTRLLEAYPDRPVWMVEGPSGPAADTWWPADH